jgi:serine/threonine protein kinase
MAPEQAAGQDAREPADVYALGVLLAELALGGRPKAELPPPGADGRVPPGSTLRKWAALNRLPAGLRALILRCTDVLPERRPPDADAVLREFRGLAGPPAAPDG